MSLTIQQIKEAIKNAGDARSTISKATDHETRIKLHSKASLSNADAGRALTGFFSLAKSLLPLDKFQMFGTLFYFPAATVSFVGKIYTALKKLFDGRNPVFKYSFENETHADDWETYRTEVLDHPNVWATKGFDTMKSSINSVIVVDLPQDPEPGAPSPYWYFLDVGDIVSFNCPTGVVFDWVIFRQGDDKIAVFDDEFFRVFETIEKGSDEIKSEPLVESPHELGYCPARFFWSTPISYSEPQIKKSPITEFLGKLDMLLFFDISNEHLNLYGRYPIYSGFAQDCDYSDQGTGEFCDGGFLKSSAGYYIIEGQSPKACPICSKRRIDGAGSYVEVDPPNKMNEGADLRNPVQITTIDRASLEYNNDDIIARKLEIFASITGFQGMPINNQAVNDKQVIAIFESLEAALVEPQDNFEEAIIWTEETICRLRYGNSFVSASVSLGTEHFILSPSQILELYQSARAGGASIATLDLLDERYFETEFRNNPDQRTRQRILANLDPFRHLTLEEVSKLYSEGLISRIDFIVKANLSSLIARFERENMNVVSFGEGVELDAKIKAIYQSLQTYASELLPTGTAESDDVKQRLEMYAIGVRSGAITPQQDDEVGFRAIVGAPPMSDEALQAWKDDQGVRRPVTLKGKTETDAQIEKLEQ